MAQKKVKQKERQIGKKATEQKPFINPRYKNAIWTGIILFILLVFFIINNTREVPERGPYPPYYDTNKVSSQ